MIHQFIKGTNHQTLIVLHGTGGNEQDMIPLAKMIDPNANILSPRGNVLEQGMPRFFKRLAFGVFDQESLETETKHLYDFIQSSANTYDFSIKDTIAIGYSNGANILASLLMSYPIELKGAVMMHPMVPKTTYLESIKPSTKCLITAGSNDMMVPTIQTQSLVNLLKKIGYDTEIAWFNQGHSITSKEIETIRSWYKKGH